MSAYDDTVEFFDDLNNDSTPASKPTDGFITCCHSCGRKTHPRWMAPFCLRPLPGGTMTSALEPGGLNLRPVPRADAEVVAKVWSAEYDPATGKEIGGQWVNQPGIQTPFGAPGDITVPGGICLPIDIDYSVPTWASGGGPVRDAMANMHSHDLPSLDEMTPKQRRRAVAVCCHCGGLFAPRRKKAGWRQLQLRGEWRPELKDPERPPRGFTTPRGGIRFVKPPEVAP